MSNGYGSCDDDGGNVSGQSSGINTGTGGDSFEVTSEQRNDGRINNGRTNIGSDSGVLIWRVPWLIASSCFYFFYLLWVYPSIVDRYWIKEQWDLALPGLNTSYVTKHSMRLHMTMGAISIFLSPIQWTTPFLRGWMNNKKISSTNADIGGGGDNLYRRLHRYSGRTYVLCGLLSYVFGQIFICLKGFELVGGYNMGIAFSLAGFAIAYFAYMTWITAPSKNRRRYDDEEEAGRRYYTIDDHRNYAIRSISQMFAPVLYRYWYGILALFRLYRTPSMNDAEFNSQTTTDDPNHYLICNDRNVCTDYLRTFDAIYCWLYWISAWIVAEIVIAFLPKHHHTNKHGNASTAPGSSEAIDFVGNDVGANDTSRIVANDIVNDMDRPLLSQRTDNNSHNYEPSTGKPNIVNTVGCFVAVSSLPITMFILYQIASAIVMK